MKLWKQLTSLKPEQQLFLGIALIVILSSLFWRSPRPFSMGASAHLGNLKGKVELEAFEGDRHDDAYLYRKKSFVLFYVPWCGYCKNVMPVWDQLYQKYNNQDLNIMKVDCEKFTNMSQKHQIDSYPTIRFYPNGLQDHKNYQTYVDTRDLSSFSRYLDENSVGRVGYQRVTESFQNANRYKAPVGYNDFEIFEPFDADEADADANEDNDPVMKDGCYLRFMAGGEGPSGPMS